MKRHCTICGHENSVTNRYCFSCGYELSKTDVLRQKVEQSNDLGRTDINRKKPKFESYREYNRKSPLIAAILTIFFGPLGVFYSSFLGGIVMTFLPIAWCFFIPYFLKNTTHSILDVINIMGGYIIMNFIAVFAIWIGSILWGISAANRHNYRLEKRIYENY